MKYTRATVRERGGKWVAMLTYHDESGKRRYLSKTIGEVHPRQGQSARDAAQAIANSVLIEQNAAAEQEAATEGTGIDLGKTVGDFMRGYVDALKESKSLEHSTLIGYGTSLGYIVADIGNVPLVALTAARVQKFVNAMNKQGYSPSTVRKAYMLLNQGMKQAMREGYLQKSPCERGAVRLPKQGYTKPNALDELGRARLLQILRGMEHTPATIAAYIALYTGMRQGEVAGLKWREVDFKSHTIHVCEAIAASSEGGTYSKAPKTNQNRYIPMASGLEAILSDWMHERMAAAGVTPKQIGKFYVVGDLEGRHRNPHTIGKDWTTIARLYNLTGTQGKRVTFHDLRHTFATATIAKGADIRSVSDILGHENVAMTLNVYADADPQAKRRTVDLLDAELSQHTQTQVISMRNGTEG